MHGIEGNVYSELFYFVPTQFRARLLKATFMESDGTINHPHSYRAPGLWGRQAGRLPPALPLLSIPQGGQ